MMTPQNTRRRNECEFLLELPHLICHVVLKRGRLLLRDGGTRSLALLEKQEAKSWLRVSLKTNAQPSWDHAHSLAAELKGEFGEYIYVEPEALAGRFSDKRQPPGQPNGHEVDLSTLTGLVHPEIPRGTSISKIAPAFRLTGGPAMTSMPATSLIPNYSLPDIGGQRKASGSVGVGLKVPLLHDAIGWAELPETIQEMLEVEAAQILANGHQPVLGVDLMMDCYSLLTVLSLQPNTSKALRRFAQSVLNCNASFYDKSGVLGRNAHD